MAAQDLERDNKRVLHEVGVDRRVEDLDRAVVTGRGEQGEGGVECDAAERSSVVSAISYDFAASAPPYSPQSLVRLGRQVQVEPAELLVVTSNQDVVSTRMYVQTTDPLHTRLQRLDQRLAGQVVKPHVSLRRSEEPRLERVERDSLNSAASFLERRLGSVSSELMDEDGFVRSCHQR